MINSNHLALERRAGGHAMTDVTTRSDLLHSTADVCSQLFDDRFDPIETGIPDAFAGSSKR